MLTFILKRIIQTIPIMLGVIFIIFLIMHLVPGDPATLIVGESAPPEVVEKVREELGLNEPFLIQYFHYIGNVLHGDFGLSYRSNRPVIDEVMFRLPTTLALSLVSILITIFIGLIAGIVSATKQNSWSDRILMIVSLIGVSFPSFWIGLMLIYIFSVKLGLLPTSGWGTVQQMILPAITLGLMGAAVVARMTRSSMLEVIRLDYIRTAKAKGLRENIIVYKHALKNALIPIITVIGLQFGSLLSGAVIIESVFSINGLGRMIVDAIKMRDLPVVQGGVLVASLLFVFVNLLVDILYRKFNKRTDAA
ncbi:nickel ABC transporter permease [Niallia sp. NCCP-28]|uniref:nickel ABC transporter permease n=1 Tax=Niallia sp. NCCP-28 TaxID=2934712 RepID=UPI00208AD3F3|nr:nickel ABC transporter permease [Niallia sp. NCCP-28]GKU85076.1 glutathione ABC transporter permease [Niallia sp. NCCP-28]